MHNLYHLLDMRMHHRVEISLHYVASKYPEKNLKIGGLVVAELDQTVVNKKRVVFSELEPPMA